MKISDISFFFLKIHKKKELLFQVTLSEASSGFEPE